MNEKINRIIIDEHICSGCERCVFVCAMGVIGMRDKPGTADGKIAYVAKPEYCMSCEACVIDCKSGAISLNPQADGLSESLNIQNISDMILKKKKGRLGFLKKK